MYLERLSKAGMDTSKYYQSQTFNKGLHTDNDLPDCTQYDVCRSYECMMVDKPYKMFNNRTAGGYPEAGNFYKDALLPKGKDLKIGAMACFDNHVAFIERVNADGTCLITDSRYDPDKSLRNDRYWRKLDNIKLVVGQKPNMYGVGVFQGCIYNAINDIRVKRNESKEQIEIIDDMVNVRLEPDGDVVMKGCYAPLGIYNIKSSKLVGDFLWFEIDENCWVRTGEWLRYYPIDSELERLKKENKILKEKLERVKEIIYE